MSQDEDDQILAQHVKGKKNYYKKHLMMYETSCQSDHPTGKQTNSSLPPWVAFFESCFACALLPGVHTV